MKRLLNTREVADFLNVNEKMVYTLVSEKELPATKITGKWLFPVHLIEKWVENNTVNFPEPQEQLPPFQGLLILAGSNDILLDKTIAQYNTEYSSNLAVFGNLGSMGGLHALRRKLCHIASSHLIQDDESEYNFQFASQEFDTMPVVVNFSKRRQGLLFNKNNPKQIAEVKDLGRDGIRMVNRTLGTGTRLLLDKELSKNRLKGERISGYEREVDRHMDVGLEILAGRADVGPGIEAVAGLLDLGFLPIRWERFDLLVSREHFFEQGVQQFLGLLLGKEFRQMAQDATGYDITLSGKILFQGSEALA